MKSALVSNEKEYYPSAIFSAFTTLPSFIGNKDFMGDIGKVFEKYKTGLTQMQELSGYIDADTEISKASFLYNPIPYYVFGEFDMAIISLIDDFGFATQHFKPNPTAKIFKYQVNTGIIPLVEAYEAEPEVPGFQDKLLPEFFNKELLYPFIAIASVKLNNAMLVGMGQSFLKLINYFLITWLDKHMRGEKIEKQGHKCFYILNENLGWNEIAVYFFGNSISYLQRQLMMVRQFTLNEMRKFLESLREDPRYDLEKLEDKILPIFEEIKQKSLLAKFIDKDTTDKNYDPLESHPIIATSATYGFSPELIEMILDEPTLKVRCKFSEVQLEVFKEECARPGLISINWKIKPGHEYEANKLISKCFPGYDGEATDSTQSGKYQFQYPLKPLSIGEYLSYASIAIKLNEDEKSLHVLKVRSHLSWSTPLDLMRYDTDKHYQYKLEKYQIKKEEILVIADKLCIYPVPYTFKNQIENLLINFNDAIMDPLMYNYFIGLKAPLLKFLEDRFDKGMYEAGNDFVPGKLERLVESADPEYLEVTLTPKDDTFNFSTLDTRSITEFIQNWNKAYWNRYFHSYYFTEINDFNIEHHGGIQQILFTYDTIYRLICKRIYGIHSKAPFINVQVVPNITSTQFYNTINFTHLFRPAIYACECVHEAANHVITFLLKQGVAFEYKFIYDPMMERTGGELERRSERDNRLRISVGPRDEYERNYLNQHFGVNAIRHIITDFCTYVLGYTDQAVSDKSDLWSRDKFEEVKKSVKVFYHTHWMLFLVRTDLYDREDSGKGYWFFNETDFNVLFIRLNLMFYLFLNFTRKDLEEFNTICPSVELNAIWHNRKHNLLDMVVRLGEALEKEFEMQTNAPKNEVREEHPSINKFRDIIISVVLDSGWDQLSDLERVAYCQAIENNQEIIKTFYEFFTEENMGYNIIKRRSAIDTDNIVGGKPVTTNVRFYDTTDREVFLDPKGHLFSTSPESRAKVFVENITYIKKMWDLSMKISIWDY